MIENTVDVICIINTRHQKQKDVKKEIHIYGYNDSCTDNETAAI